MTDVAASASLPPGPRRRVGALLNAYYHIEGSPQSNEPAKPIGSVGQSDLDRQGFDAKRYFDATVGSGQLPELIKRANELDAEIKDLDGDMQMLVYENYSKFIRATDVIKQMKFTIEGLTPDLKALEGNVARLTEHQRKVEDGVSTRAMQIDGVLKQQRVCRKLKLLFRLPDTLQRCLDQGAYGKAVEAYCCCSSFLRQYRHMPTFQKVLEEVEHQMGRIRSALEQRLRSPDLSVDEAVNSSVTLLDLGEDQAKVTKEYLTGRTSMLRQSLDKCFDPTMLEQAKLEDPSSEGVMLSAACAALVDLYVPQLCASVEGFQKLAEGRAAAREAEGPESLLSDFVTSRILSEMCGRISSLLERHPAPNPILVACVHSVRDSLKRLHTLLPRLMTKLFLTFLSRTANDAMKVLFSDASSQLVADLFGLHGQCKRLAESNEAGLDDVLEEIAKTEQSLIMHGFTALTECQPLLGLLGSDKPACQLFLRGLQEQLVRLFSAFVEACHGYIGGQGRAVEVPASIDLALLSSHSIPAEELQKVASLEWCGLFALALVRIGRHLEVKAIAKVWAVAKDLFAGDASGELTPPPAVVKTTRMAAQAVITHYSMVNGQRLAHFFRNSVQSRNWMTVREPREPRLVVEMVLREVHAFDAQLARILGDPRKPAGRSERRQLSRFKNSMELEMERLWAKKLQVFAPIPFNRNGAIVGVLRIAFKALYEYMREETFAKFGLQQIQVDCAFLSEVVRDFVEPDDASVLDSLLDEAVTSAAQRCDDPVLMETSMVEQLCEEKKKKGFKLE